MTHATAQGQHRYREPYAYCVRALGARWVGRWLSGQLDGTPREERADVRRMLIEALYSALRALDLDAPLKAVGERLRELGRVRLEALAWSQHPHEPEQHEPKPLRTGRLEQTS